MTLGTLALVLAAVALLVELLMKRVPYAGLGLTIFAVALFHLIH
jgi:hypothetical protein